ncbi:Uncharacterised protein [uncultured archaeon]|nr:Uncharacterised protein [uncultured archaeon]
MRLEVAVILAALLVVTSGCLNNLKKTDSETEVINVTVPPDILEPIPKATIKPTTTTTTPTTTTTTESTTSTTPQTETTTTKAPTISCGQINMPRFASECSKGACSNGKKCKYQPGTFANPEGKCYCG